MGTSVPSVYKTGYDYARMGYSYVNEAAMPPLHSPHVHEEIRDTPIIDISAMPVFGNNWFSLEYLKNNEIENNAAYTAWLLRATRGFGIKIVNPGGSEAWGWGLNCANIHEPVPYFDVTPAQIIKGSIETNEYPRSPPLDPHSPEQPREPRQLRRYAGNPQARRGVHREEHVRQDAGHAPHAPAVPLLRW